MEHEPARILVVCTANVCRSPMAAALLGHRLAEAGVSARVTSAGTHDVALPVDPNAVAVCRDLGVELAHHQPRRFSRDILTEDGRDLIITMTRQHLREVVTTDRSAWHRTFTLRELVRRASIDPPGDDLGLEDAWAVLTSGRRPSDLMGADPVDDIEDPYGGPLDAVRRCGAELDTLTRQVASLRVWRRVVDAPHIR
jgi:protein-tyrosine phosphatase